MNANLLDMLVQTLRSQGTGETWRITILLDPF